jgi:hypothetical protein
VTAYANQPLYVHIPSIIATKPHVSTAPAPASTATASDASSGVPTPTPVPVPAPVTAAWEDLWPISDLRAEQEHIRHHSKSASSSVASSDPHHNLLLSTPEYYFQCPVIASLMRCYDCCTLALLGLAEVQCDDKVNGRRVRYPFAPFRADPADVAPFFPFDIAHTAPTHTTFDALPVPLPQSAWLSLFTQLPYVRHCP